MFILRATCKNYWYDCNTCNKFSFTGNSIQFYLCRAKSQQQPLRVKKNVHNLVSWMQDGLFKQFSNDRATSQSFIPITWIWSWSNCTDTDLISILCLIKLKWGSSDSPQNADETAKMSREKTKRIISVMWRQEWCKEELMSRHSEAGSELKLRFIVRWQTEN